KPLAPRTNHWRQEQVIGAKNKSLAPKMARFCQKQTACARPRPQPGRTHRTGVRRVISRTVEALPRRRLRIAASLLSLSRPDPLQHPPLEHVQRHRARAEHHIVKLADVERRS